MVEKPQTTRKVLNSAFTICLGLCLHAWQWKLLLKMIAMVAIMDDINFPIVINISTMMINWCIWRLSFRGLALPFNHSKLSNSLPPGTYLKPALFKVHLLISHRSLVIVPWRLSKLPPPGLCSHGSLSAQCFLIPVIAHSSELTFLGPSSSSQSELL